MEYIMAKKLTPERAAELRAAGITHIASVVKNYRGTDYYGVASIDAILANGGDRPRRGNVVSVSGNILPTECGVTWRRVNWSATIRWTQI